MSLLSISSQPCLLQHGSAELKRATEHKQSNPPHHEGAAGEQSKCRHANERGVEAAQLVALGHGRTSCRPSGSRRRHSQPRRAVVGHEPRDAHAGRYSARRRAAKAAVTHRSIRRRMDAPVLQRKRHERHPLRRVHGAHADHTVARGDETHAGARRHSGQRGSHSAPLRRTGWSH